MPVFAIGSNKGRRCGLAIDAAGIGILGYLLKRDLDAQDKRVARMTREEGLGGLQIELADKKSSRLAQLRQFVRIVNVAGTSQQMSDALEEAEEFRELLVELGFMIIPLPIFEESDAQKDKHNQLKDIDLRDTEQHTGLLCLANTPDVIAKAVLGKPEANWGYCTAARCLGELVPDPNEDCQQDAREGAVHQSEYGWSGARVRDWQPTLGLACCGSAPSFRTWSLVVC
ncbi:hypothetical protein WJX77_001393 [Trebouxia sp. C0004]